MSVLLPIIIPHWTQCLTQSKSSKHVCCMYEWILSAVLGEVSYMNTKDFLKVNHICFQKSRIRHGLSEYFTTQIEIRHAITKSKNFVNEICKYLLLRCHCVKKISPVSLRLCNVYRDHVKVQTTLFITTQHINEQSMSFTIHSR